VGNFTHSVEVMQVCDLLLNGYSTAEIARKLRMTEASVLEIERVLQDACAYEEG
jgi:DNA-binding NarL/FixJ family response regulator